MVTSQGERDERRERAPRRTGGHEETGSTAPLLIRWHQSDNYWLHTISLAGNVTNERGRETDGWAGEDSGNAPASANPGGERWENQSLHTFGGGRCG